MATSTHQLEGQTVMVLQTLVPVTVVGYITFVSARKRLMGCGGLHQPLLVCLP